MLVEVTVFVTKFKGQIIDADSLSDMYSEAQLRITVGSEEYEYIKVNLDKFSGDRQIKDAYIMQCLAKEKDICISGEAKDCCFSVGEFETKLEYRKIPWE